MTKIETNMKIHSKLINSILSLKHNIEQKSFEQDELTNTRAKLKETETRYRNLHDNIPLGVYRRTPGFDGRLLMVNPALVKMFGYDSADELNKVRVASLYYDSKDCEAFSKDLFEHGDIIKQQLKMKKKDGTPVWAFVSAMVICDKNGKPVYFDGIMEDITENVRQEKEIRLRQEQLLQADKMISLGILVSGVAHEINNPNQFVVSHLSLLKRVWKDTMPVLDRYHNQNGDFRLAGVDYCRMRERVDNIWINILEGTSRITHIINELRDYARDNPLNVKEKVDLNKVVRSSLSILQNLTKNSTSAFYVTYGKDLPFFLGDYHKIEQVVINLVQNACQAFKDEKGDISIVTFCQEDSRELVFQINDTGCGIANQDLSRIRDPFFTTKRSTGGIGLGLSISETIITHHGGRMDFISEEGEGTTVRVFLPYILTDKKEVKN